MYLQDMTNPDIKAFSKATKRSLALGTQVDRYVILFSHFWWLIVLFLSRNGQSPMTLCAPAEGMPTPLSSLLPPVGHMNSPAQTVSASQSMKGKKTTIGCLYIQFNDTYNFFLGAMEYPTVLMVQMSQIAVWSILDQVSSQTSIHCLNASHSTGYFQFWRA